MARTDVVGGDRSMGTFAEAVAERVEGMNRQKAGDHAAALARFDRSLALFQQVEAGVQVAWTAQNRALVLEQLGRVDEARSAFAEALTLFERHAERAGIPLMHRRRGDLERRAGRLDVALVEYGVALARYQADRDPNGVINTLSSIAAAHLAAGRHGEARSALYQALEQLRSFPRRSGEYDFLVLSRLAQAETALGNAEAGAELTRQATALADELRLRDDRSNPDVVAALG